MVQVEFGLVLPPGSGWTSGTTRASFVTDTAQALNRISGSFDSVWLADHLDASPRDMPEGWSTLCFLAGQYPALKFTLLACYAFRNPALFAKMAATLHYLTNGRLIFSIGAGSNPAEFTPYGYPLPSPGVRVEQLEEALQLIKMLWNEPAATFKGQYYSIENAHCEPRHLTVPTLLIGAFKPRMMRVAARHADWWNTCWVGPDEYRALVDELSRACNAVGRDIASVRKTYIGFCSCAASEGAAHRAIKGTWFDGLGGWGLIGTPDQIVVQLQPFIDAGMDYLVVSFPGWPDLPMLDLFIDEVIPLIKSAYGSPTVTRTSP